MSAVLPKAHAAHLAPVRSGYPAAGGRATKVPRIGKIDASMTKLPITGKTKSPLFLGITNPANADDGRHCRLGTASPKRTVLDMAGRAESSHHRLDGDAF
jgi:hypothetical protein